LYLLLQKLYISQKAIFGLFLPQSHEENIKNSLFIIEKTLGVHVREGYF